MNNLWECLSICISENGFGKECGYFAPVSQWSMGVKLLNNTEILLLFQVRK